MGRENNITKRDEGEFSVNNFFTDYFELTHDFLPLPLLVLRGQTGS